MYWPRELLIALALLMTASCGGGPKKVRQDPDDIPDWAINPPKGCAVGIAELRRNLSLAKSTAATRGRDELARQLKTRVVGLMRDYAAQGEEDGQDFTEDLTRQTAEQLVNTVLHGTRARINKLDENDPQHFYALICLEPETFAGAFEQMNRLDKRARAALKQRAEDEFENLHTQLEKLGVE